MDFEIEYKPEQRRCDAFIMYLSKCGFKDISSGDMAIALAVIWGKK